MPVKSKAERGRNKVYHLKVKSILLEDVFPLLYEKGWMKTPFKSDFFGTRSQGMAWVLHKFEDRHCQSLVIYLSRHWSGYDRNAFLQIEYRVATVPDVEGDIWDYCDLSPVFDHKDCLKIEHRFRPLGLYLDRRYGVKVSRFQWLTERRVERCRQELIAAFQDMEGYRAEWDVKHETPIWALNQAHGKGAAQTSLA